MYRLTSLLGRLIVSFRLERARSLGAFLGGVAWQAAGKERAKTLANLNQAYGHNLSDRQKWNLGQRVFRNAGICAVEGFFLTAGKTDKILQDVRVEGLEHLQEALGTGRGVLCLTAHYGNWELLTPFMPRLIDRPIGVVARELSNPWIDRDVVRMREQFGARVFPRGSTGRDYIRFLRQGNALAVLGDIDTSKGGGIYVDFFGRPAWTQTGIARLARMGKSSIVPAFISRDPQDPSRQVIRIEPMIPQPEGVSEEEYTLSITQAFTLVIEQAVRRHPEQWMWMHRRWRHQPKPGEIEALRDQAAREKRPGLLTDDKPPARKEATA